MDIKCSSGDLTTISSISKCRLSAGSAVRVVSNVPYLNTNPDFFTLIKANG